MGLMADVPWGSFDAKYVQPPAIDFHRGNIKHIQQLSSKVRQKRNQSIGQERIRPKPIRAFAIPDSDRVKGYNPLQPTLYDWTIEGKGPSEPFQSSENMSETESKKFLLSHQKTGPFVPSYAGSVSSAFRKPRSMEKLPEDSFDGFHAEIQSVMKSTTSRFSDLSIGERKQRIQFLVDEIFSVEPLCKEHLTRQTMERNLRKFASSDQISDLGSIRDGSVRTQASYQAKQQKALSRALSSSKINVCYVEPLTRAQLQKHDSKHWGKFEAENSVNKEKRKSPTPLVGELRSQQGSRTSYVPQHYNVPESPEVLRSVSRVSRNSRSETPNNLDDAIERSSVLARGTDIDYVSANIESVSVVGHNKRKEVKAVKEALSVKKPSLALPETYKAGSVPKYLQERQSQWKEEADRKEREKPDPDCPPNHVRLNDESRIEALNSMRSQHQELLAELSKFSVRADSIRIRQRKRDIEDEMTSLEAKMKVYERQKVFIPKS